MFKIAIRNPDTFIRLNAIPLLRRLTTLRLTSVPSLSRDQWVSFSDSFRGPGGAYMSTRRGRFSDIDPMIPRLLSRDRRNLIHDVGVSCGVTSLELYDRLVATGLAFKMYVSDRNAELYATGDRICRVYDAHGEFVEGYFFFLLGRTSRSWTGPVARGLGWFLRRAPRISQGTTIPMFHRDLRDRIERGEIHGIDYDLFRAGPTERFSFVRCMNVLIGPELIETPSGVWYTVPPASAPSPLIQVSTTRSPGRTFVTPAPTLSTTPEPSWPRVWGRKRSGPRSPRTSRSWLRQTPL